MIEAETVQRFSTLGGKVKMPSAICVRGAKYGHAILGAIRHDHVSDWIAVTVQYNAFDFLSRLGRADDDEFSHRRSGRYEERARKRDGY